MSACNECEAPSETSVSGVPHGNVSDRLGVGVSATCAVHCAAMGSLSLAPSFSSSLEFLETIEWPLMVMALVLGLWSLVPSYRKHHRWQPLALFGVGLVHLVVSRLVHGYAEIAVTVLGVSLIASAHAFNLRFCGECQDHATHTRPHSHAH